MLYRARPRWSCAGRSEGEIAFLPGHVPFLGALDDGSVRVILPGEGEQAHRGARRLRRGGDDRVIVLSRRRRARPDTSTSIAPERAQADAEARVAADADDEDAQQALLRAETRLKVAGATAAA